MHDAIKNSLYGNVVQEEAKIATKIPRWHHFSNQNLIVKVWKASEFLEIAILAVFCVSWAILRKVQSDNISIIAIFESNLPLDYNILYY